MATRCFTEAIRDLFLSHPGEWIPVSTLMRVGGQCAWRTRVSEARRKYGMTIENRVQTYQDDGETFRVSAYRYVPTEVSHAEVVVDLAEADRIGSVSAPGASVAPGAARPEPMPPVRSPGVAARLPLW